MTTFADVWGSDHRAQLPQILSSYVLWLQGKHLVAEIDKLSPHQVNVTLPLPRIHMRDRTTGGQMCYSTLFEPKDELPRFVAACNAVLNSCSMHISEVVRNYVGQDHNPATITFLTEQLREMERSRISSGRPPLWRVLAWRLGFQNVIPPPLGNLIFMEGNQAWLTITTTHYRSTASSSAGATASAPWRPN